MLNPMLFRPTHHVFGPHVTPAYLRRSMAEFLRPWRWRNGGDLEKLRQMLERWFGGHVHLFYCGREALTAYLRSLPKQGEIIVQGYTCVAVPNAIFAAGCTPVFADIDPETLNMNAASVEALIGPDTRAIFCQNTFGIVSDTKTLREIADRHGILLIEDCAHILPDVTGPKSIGTHADALMLSFGRDKAVSGIGGGAIIVKDTDSRTALETAERDAKNAPLLHVLRLLCYPPFYALIRPLYGLGIGKALAYAARRLRLLPPVLTAAEREGKVSKELRKMPNSCAALALWEFKQLHTINNHRRTLTKFYLSEASLHGWNVPAGIHEHLPLQKFVLLTPNASALLSALRAENIHLKNGWLGAVVCPQSVNQEAAGYKKGNCPNAERVSANIVHLPTHPTTTLAQAKALTTALTRLLR